MPSPPDPRQPLVPALAWLTGITVVAPSLSPVFWPPLAPQVFHTSSSSSTLISRAWSPAISRATALLASSNTASSRPAHS